MTHTLDVFDTRDEQANQLANFVGGILCQSTRQDGRASLAVPGGTTPGSFLTRLGELDLNWRSVSVTLTDERCVPATDRRSNERLARQTLMASDAAPDFVPLYARAADGGPALDQVDAALTARALPFDVVVLGMGKDGHTASLFPGAENLEEALDPTGDPAVIALTAPGAPEPRISLTLPAMLSARHICVLITGQDKRETLDWAIGSGPVAEAPIRAVLRARADTRIWWAP